MPTQPGDHLASGATSATFHMAAETPTRSKRRVLKIQEKKNLFCLCRDCNFKAYSAAEFSDHIHYDCIKPIPWGNERPVAAKNVAEVRERSGKTNMKVPE